jgi:hypothetical protein
LLSSALEDGWAKFSGNGILGDETLKWLDLFLALDERKICLRRVVAGPVCRWIILDADDFPVCARSLDFVVPSLIILESIGVNDVQGSLSIAAIVLLTGG